MRTVIDDQAFVVGLSELFRQEMKAYEVTSLLPLAESVCETLGLSPADVPIEGYYAESTELQRFFRLIRSLQNAGSGDNFPDSTQRAIYRLREVLNSPAMGRVENHDRLIARTTSAFGEALQTLSSWSIDSLSRQAQLLVRKDDAGLLAVAAAAGNPVGLCAARETMALMADVELAETQLPEFDWRVSEHVAEVADRFICTLAKATGIQLPQPNATSSLAYGMAAADAELIGRCILVGERNGTPCPYYHWYIDLQDGQPRVKDFWSDTIWTTAILNKIPPGSRPAEGAHIEASHWVNKPDDKGIGPASVHKEDPVRRGWIARLLQRRR